LYFWLAFLQCLVMLNIFSHTYWLCVCLFLTNVYWKYLFVNLDIIFVFDYLFVDEFGEVLMYSEYESFVRYSLQVLCPFCRLSLRSDHCLFHRTETLNFNVISFFYFCFCLLCFWILSKNSLPIPMSWSISSMVSSSAFLF
jgi:hypothetical protein